MLNACRRHGENRVRVSVDIGTRLKCSTPVGVTVKIAVPGQANDTKAALCSTPVGVTVKIALYGAAALALVEGAQRLSASR